MAKRNLPITWDSVKTKEGNGKLLGIKSDDAREGFIIIAYIPSKKFFITGWIDENDFVQGIFKHKNIKLATYTYNLRK